MRNPVACSLSLALLIAGCGGERQRWSSVSGISDQAATPTVSVYLAPTDPPGNPKLTDLSDKGQAALISELGKLSKTGADFRSNYQKFFKGDSSGAADRTIMNRLLVVGISKDSYRPADRIVSATITIEPVDFSFAGYSLVATTYNSLDLDKVDIKNEYTGSAEINPTLSGSIKGPVDFKTGIDRTTDHSYTVTDVAPKPYVDVQPCKLTLTEGSEPNQDITGTTIIKLTLVANSFTSVAPSSTAKCRTTANSVAYHLIASDQTLFKDGRPLAAEKASITASGVQYNRGQLHAKVAMKYEYRYVSSGAKSVIEDDDAAVYTPGIVYATNDETAGNKDTAVSIVDGGDPGGALWALCDGSSILALHQSTGQGGTILFDDLSKATEMAKWLSVSKKWSIGTSTMDAAGDHPSPFPAFKPCRDLN